MRLKNNKFAVILLTFVMFINLLGSTVFAVENDDPAEYTVTIYVEQVYRDDEGIGYQQTLTDAPLSYTAVENQTLKEVINDIAGDEVYFKDAEWVDNYGNIDTSWLSSLDVYTDDLEDWVNYLSWYDYYPIGDEYVYEGESWMYFLGTPANIPATVDDYPGTLIGDYVITGDITITLSFEYNIFTY
ncbi:MAG: hypothetical protein LBL26_09960 [Peptococcaceae bacterium]|nr:hypothetical protein [Peptococcaceae bacterium]